MKRQIWYDVSFVMWTIVLIVFVIYLVGCKSEPVVGTGNCASKAMTLPLRDGRTVKLPATGKVVQESHYVTNDDVFPINVYPSTLTEDIEFHLKESCGLLQKWGAGSDCSNVYDNKYARQWTPAEGGKIGQGSRGRHRLSLESELWAATMNLKTNFEPNTRILARFGAKAVVLSIGHEIGPSTHHIMGMSPEAHWYLGTDNNSFIEIEYLLDQSLPFGPIKCLEN